MLRETMAIGIRNGAAMLLGAGCATSSHDTATRPRPRQGTAPAATTAGVWHRPTRRVEVIPGHRTGPTGGWGNHHHARAQFVAEAN